MARRVSLYFSWDRDAETGATPAELEDRYPALFELRRAAWPATDGLDLRPKQGIDGFLEDVVLGDFQEFRKAVEGTTGRPVPLYERQLAGTRTELGAALGACDTAIVVSLDHVRTQQRPTATELDAARSFLRAEGRCLIVCPHHYVGAPAAGEDESATRARQEHEQAHHGDRLVPRRQIIGGFARALLAGLGLPVENRFGLLPRPADDGEPFPLEIDTRGDSVGFLDGVTTFNLHPHLPDLVPETEAWTVLARQHVDPGAPAHPTHHGPTFAALLWAPPDGDRAGHVLVCDATLWSSAFGGVASLQRFWENVATRT